MKFITLITLFLLTVVAMARSLNHQRFFQRPKVI